MQGNQYTNILSNQGSAVKPFVIVFTCLFCMLQYKLWFESGGVAEAWTLHNQVISEQTENQALSDRNAALAAEVVDLKHGKAAIEERARTELGMVKHQEIFYQVFDHVAS